MATRVFKEVLEQVVIGDMVEQMRYIARVDSLVIFVTQVAPGEVVDLGIIRKKKGYAEDVPVRIHSASHVRVQPVCNALRAAR